MLQTLIGRSKREVVRLSEFLYIVESTSFYLVNNDVNYYFIAIEGFARNFLFAFNLSTSKLMSILTTCLHKLRTPFVKVVFFLIKFQAITCHKA